MSQIFINVETGNEIYNYTDYTVWLVLGNNEPVEILDNESLLLSKGRIQRIRVHNNNDASAWVLNSDESWRLPKDAVVQLRIVNGEESTVLEVATEGEKHLCHEYRTD